VAYSTVVASACVINRVVYLNDGENGGRIFAI